MEPTNIPKDEMQAYHDARRKAYMAQAISHQDFYHDLAEKFGLEYLQRVVFTIATRQQLTRALAKDQYLNSIDLQYWDARDPMVRQHAVRAGMRSWSLSDTVCTLKAVARRMVEDGEKNAKE